MPQTVVGLFESATLAENAVRDIVTLGLPRKEVRTLQEPATFPVDGVMSFPRLDFETDLTRELTRIGATSSEAQSLLDGLRRGGALCLATGSGDDLEDAARIMNKHGAVEIDQVVGGEPSLPAVHRHAMAAHDSGVMAGRVRRDSGSACFFVW